MKAATVSGVSGDIKRNFSHIFSIKRIFRIFLDKKGVFATDPEKAIEEFWKGIDELELPDINELELPELSELAELDGLEDIPGLDDLDGLELPELDLPDLIL